MSEFVSRMRALRKAWIEKTGEPTFLGIPESWYEPVRFRCEKGHVSRTILKSEERGDLCLACFSPVMITWPGDQDGPMPESL